MYYVIFKDGTKWCVKDCSFVTRTEAEVYRDKICKSRSPRVVKDVQFGE